MVNRHTVSIKDVAQMAGVSIATVSRVINNKGRFSEATRDRVQQIIDETGYIPNIAAKTLRETQTKTIGLVVPDISNDFYSMLALHIERILSEHNYSVFICNTDNERDRARWQLHTLVGKRVDGIITVGWQNGTFADQEVTGIPLVYIDRYPEDTSNVPVVLSDDFLGGYLATKHLLDQGCQRIMLLFGLEMDIDRELRTQGYKLALLEAGLEVQDDLLLMLDNMNLRDVEPNRQLLERIQAGPAFDGVFATSDFVAVSTLRALEQAGIRVPQDVRLVGFDDSVYTSITRPAITSVQRFPEKIAQKGCEVLLETIGGNEVSPVSIMPVELVIRESSVCL